MKSFQNAQKYAISQRHNVSHSNCAMEMFTVKCRLTSNAHHIGWTFVLLLSSHAVTGIGATQAINEQTACQTDSLVPVSCDFFVILIIIYLLSLNKKQKHKKFQALSKLAKMDFSLPYKVSYSDGESKCKKCRKEIRSGEIRIAIMMQVILV